MTSPVLGLMLLSLASSAEPITLATPDFAAANVKPEVAQFCATHFSQQLSLRGLRVVTAQEITALLGFERQKQLFGCADEATSCLAELGNALGVDGLVTGSLGQFGAQVVVNIKVVKANDGRQLALYSGTAATEAALPRELERAAETIAQEVSKSLGRPLSREAPPTRTTRATKSSTPPARTNWGVRQWALVPTVGGIVFGVASGLAFGQLAAHRRAFDNPNLPVDEAFAHADAAQEAQVRAYGGAALATVLLGAGLGLYFSAADEKPKPVVAWTADGPMVGITGSLP